MALTRFLVKGEASVHVHHLSPCSPGPNVPVEQRGVHSSYFCCLQNLKKISKTFSGFFFSFFRHKPSPSATGDTEINGMVSASKIYQSNGKMVTERANCDVGNKDHSKRTKYQVSRGEGIFNSIDHIGLGGVE